jgi:hypothetical protein
MDNEVTEMWNEVVANVKQYYDNCLKKITETTSMLHSQHTPCTEISSSATLCNNET